MNMKVNKISLPETIGIWTQKGSPQLITTENIFDYMNGAGELYLSYHFDSLEVYEYKAGEQNEILVELYYMKGSDDAFGLLSLDWGGEAVILTPSATSEPDHGILPNSRALYGKGLLRLWSDNLYVRIMATRDTASAKKVIFQLGKIITAGRRVTPQPKMLQVLSPTIGSKWRLQKERTSYFYSHLVLNSQYYLSHENLLNLNHTTEVVFAPYEKIQNKKPQDRIHLIIIKYPDVIQARKAWDHFVRIYLPELQKQKKKPADNIKEQFFKIEDGWVGYKLKNNFLELVFECPDIESGRMILNQRDLNLKNKKKEGLDE